MVKPNELTSELGAELAALLKRDLQRLAQEIAAFPDEESLWATVPGVNNSAGNLVLHLEGNLWEYVGRQLGGLPFTRNRPAEFSTRGVSRAELQKRVERLLDGIPAIITNLPENVLETPYPENVLNREWSTRQYLLHCYAHFSYHLGQIDYLRRVLTARGALDFVQL